MNLRFPFASQLLSLLLVSTLAVPTAAQIEDATNPQAPLSPSLLGIVNLAQQIKGPGAAFASSTLQGDGTVNNPYIRVQVPGFDKDIVGAASPWKSGRVTDGNGAVTCSALEPVQVMTTNRRHVRLLPFYRDTNTGVCNYGPNCGVGMLPQPVELRQGLIHAGGCSYGSISFDVRINPNSDDPLVCADPTYLTVSVEEASAPNGTVGMVHAFDITRTMVTQYGLQSWKRLTFHFALSSPGSLLNVSFRLGQSKCPPNGFGGHWVYPASADLDNVALETIPVVTLGPGNAILSGCASGMPGACGVSPLVIYPDVYRGVPVTLAMHDAYAQVLCPQSFCAADLDYDGNIGAQDLAFLLSDWGSLPTVECTRRFADLDGDGQVGAADLAYLLGSWGPCP